MPNLRRLDWDNCIVPYPNSRRLIPSPRALWSSENLQVLSLGGDNYLLEPEFLQRIPTSPIHLPAVHTIRIRTLLAFGIPHVMFYKMLLPSLRRVIIEKAIAMYTLTENCLTHCGKQVKIVEIGCDIKFLHSDYVSTILLHCPNLEEVYFPIFWTRPFRRRPSAAHVRYPTVRSVGLHGLDNGLEETESQKWDRLTQHFDSFCGVQTKFTGLQNIKLFGCEWAAIVLDRRFSEILSIATEKNVTITAEDDTVSRHLRSLTTFKTK